MKTSSCRDGDHRHRWTVYALTLFLLFSFFKVTSDTAIASTTANKLSVSGPEVSFIVRVVDDRCWRNTEPRQASYSSVNEAVKDTIPGEWWPPTGYGVTMVNGALKSASIIVRSRINYHNLYPLYPSQGYAYSTANVDWPANQNYASRECQLVGEWQMNTILPKDLNSYEGGSKWGNQVGYYESNLATDATGDSIIVGANGARLATEWNMAVETRTVVCNYQSRNWGFCAINALAEHLNSPWGHNRLARRFSPGPTNSVSFKTQAYNSNTGRSGRYWQSYSSGGFYWGGYLRAEPNNGTGFAGNEGYQNYSPVLAYKVPFPQSGVFYVCILGRGGTPADDSVHAGLDDNGDGVADTTTALDMTSVWHTSSWQWANQRSGGSFATVQVSGDSFHTFKIWMREDGMSIDEVILSTSSACPS